MKLVLALSCASLALFASSMDLPAQQGQRSAVQPSAPRTAALATVRGGDPRIPIGPGTTPGDADSSFRIAAPGSYVLTGNLAGVAGKAGIEVAAAGVEIDLMGFELQGAVGSLAGVRGVGFAVRNVTVRNGTVRDWGGAGIDLAVAENTRVLEVFAFGNDAQGIRLASQGQVEGCIARGNDGSGIEVGDNAQVLASSSSSNGHEGIHVGLASVVRDCVTDQNFRRGIRAGSGSVIEGSTASRNTGSDGILAGARVTIRGCTAVDNSVEGIELSSGLVRDCTVARNQGTGIRAGGNSLVVENVLEQNDGHGILVAGGHTRIDSNLITQHVEPGTSGIHIIGERCVVVRNHATLNTAFLSSNTQTHFVGVSVGFGSSTTTTNPWANFVD